MKLILSVSLEDLRFLGVSMRPGLGVALSGDVYEMFIGKMYIDRCTFSYTKFQPW